MPETREPLYIDEDTGLPVYGRNVVCLTRTCGNYRYVIVVPDNGSTVTCGGSGQHPTVIVNGQVRENRDITPDPDNPVPDVLPPDPNPLPPVVDELNAEPNPEPEAA